MILSLSICNKTGRPALWKTWNSQEISFHLERTWKSQGKTSVLRKHGMSIAIFFYKSSEISNKTVLSLKRSIDRNFSNHLEILVFNEKISGIFFIFFVTLLDTL